MAIAADLLQSLVPISQFNKGQAAEIFDRLHSERELIVLKNNQSCVRKRYEKCLLGTRGIH